MLFNLAPRFKDCQMAHPGLRGRNTTLLFPSFSCLAVIISQLSREPQNWSIQMPTTKGKLLRLNVLSLPGDRTAFVYVQPHSLSIPQKARNLRKKPIKRRVSNSSQANLLGPNYANGMVKCNLPKGQSLQCRWTLNSSPGVTLNCPCLTFGLIGSDQRLGVQQSAPLYVALYIRRCHYQ